MVGAKTTAEKRETNRKLSVKCLEADALVKMEWPKYARRDKTKKKIERRRVRKCTLPLHVQLSSSHLEILYIIISQHVPRGGKK